MDKRVNVILGFFLGPIGIAALVAARPSFDGGRRQEPSNEVLYLEPGDTAFRRIRLNAPHLQASIALGEDGALYVTGKPAERFLPTGRAFTVSDKTDFVRAPPNAPFEGKTWITAPSTFLRVADAPSGTPEILRTAIAEKGTWSEGPIFLDNVLVYDAAGFPDGSIAVGLQHRGIWLGRPGDAAFHNAEIEGDLPNGQLWHFGKGLIHISSDTRESDVPYHLRTRFIDLETHKVTPGPDMEFPVEDYVEFDSGGVAGGGGVIIVANRVVHAFDTARLPMNITGAIVFLLDAIGITLYLRRKNRREREGLLMFIGAVLGCIVAIVGAYAILMSMYGGD